MIPNTTKWRNWHKRGYEISETHKPKSQPTLTGITPQRLFPVGKHRGQPLADIPDQYLLWVKRTFDRQSLGLRMAVWELKRRSKA